MCLSYIVSIIAIAILVYVIFMNYHNKEMIDKWVEQSPILSFNDIDTLNTLNGYFGDRWHQPFKDWFMEHFKKPIKTIE